MTDATLLELLAALPDDAQITVTVSTRALAAALEQRGANSAQLVGTTRLVELYGMSREWWADQAPKIPGASRETPTSPWWIPVGAAGAYLESYWAARRGVVDEEQPAETRSRRRAPWKGGRS